MELRALFTSRAMKANINHEMSLMTVGAILGVTIYMFRPRLIKTACVTVRERYHLWGPRVYGAGLIIPTSELRLCNSSR